MMEPTRLQDVLNLLRVHRELQGFGSGESVVRRHHCDSDRPSAGEEVVHQHSQSFKKVWIVGACQKVHGRV